MSNVVFFNLASIEAVRPVFMIVMGVFLMLVAWRIAKETDGWSARLTVGGAFLLCLGYAILIPMYEAGVIEKFHPSLHLHDSAAAMGWHAVKLVVMNTGWLLFGLGVGIHSGLLHMPVAFKLSKIESLHSHEPVA
ncbi:MAG: hypothetical protein ABJQ29_01095 [Luteolibacter sp.]